MKTLEYLERTLKKPDSGCRPVQMLHHGFPKTPRETERFLDIAQKNGLGGFCVNMDVPLTRVQGESDDDYRLRCLDAYLSEGSPEAEAVWTALCRFIDCCFERDFKIWIYDEKAYPSGAAGNKVISGHPEHAAKGLIAYCTESNGGRGEMPLDEGELRFAAAYRLSADGVMLTEDRKLVSPCDGVLRWELPCNGEKYRIAAFYTRPVNFLTENKAQYTDLMSADAVRRFIDVTYETYLRRLGKDRISRITAFFTDEPGLPVHGCSSYFYETGAVAAWTPEMDTLLPADMPERYADLFFDTDRDYALTRRLWWSTAAKLFGENYFKQIADWCEKHGTQLTGHLYGEETLSMQTGLNADLFGLMRYMQMPGVDRLYCTNPRDVTAEKTASSAAHLYGKKRTMSENSFHLENNFWHTPETVTDENRLNSAFYQAQLGITNAASYFPYPDKESAARLEYEEKSARVSLFCATGTHRTDILVLIPLCAAYERFTPPAHKYWDVGPCITAPHQPEPVQRLELAFGTVLRELEDRHYDFDLADGTALCGLKADGGILSGGGESFNTLVIFDSGFFSGALTDKITLFLNEGGHVVVIDTDCPTGFCAQLENHFPENVTRSGPSLFGNILLAARPLLSIFEACPEIRIRRSETNDATLWFLHNRTNQSADITLAEEGSFILFDTDGNKKKPMHGKIRIPAKNAVMLIKEKY